MGGRGGGEGREGEECVILFITPTCINVRSIFSLLLFPPPPPLSLSPHEGRRGNRWQLCSLLLLPPLDLSLPIHTRSFSFPPPSLSKRGLLAGAANAHEHTHSLSHSLSLTSLRVSTHVRFGASPKTRDFAGVLVGGRAGGGREGEERRGEEEKKRGKRKKWRSRQRKWRERGEKKKKNNNKQVSPRLLPTFPPPLSLPLSLLRDTHSGEKEEDCFCCVQFSLLLPPPPPL